MADRVDGSLIFDTKIDTKGFTTGTNTLKKQANGLSTVFKKLGTLIGLAFVGRLGKQAIQLSSDLQEVQNVVDTAFGEMSYKMEQFADTCLETYGISELTAKEMGSVFMAMAKGIGQSADIASDKAVEMTGRMADIMSFYNKTASEVNTIGRAVYSGETEPLKQIGIIMTETNLNTYTLAKGYKNLYKEMTAQEKLFVRQEYFLEQTNMAAGDFTKTVDSWANQTRILSERWKEFLSVIGNTAIQVLTPTIKSLNTALSYMTALAKATGEVLSEVFGFKQVAQSTQQASAGIETLGDTVKETSKKVSKSMAPIDELNIIAESMAKSTDDAADSLGTIGDISVGGGIDYGSFTKGDTELEKKIDSLKEKIRPFAKALKKFYENVKPLAGEVGKGFTDFIKKIYDTGAEAIDGWIPDGINSIAEALGKIDPATAYDIGGALGKIALVLAGWKIIPGLVDFLRGIGKGISGISSLNPNMLAEVFGDLVANFDTWLFNALPQWTRDLYDKIGEVFNKIFESMWDGIVSSFNTLFNFDKTLALFDEIKKHFGLISKDAGWKENGKNIALGVLKGILLPFQSILEPIDDFFVSLWKGFCNVFGIHSPAKEMIPIGKYISEGVLKGFVSVFTSFPTKIGELMDKIKATFSTKITSVKTTVTSMFTSIKDGVAGIMNNMKSSIATTLNNIYSKFATVFGNIKTTVTSIFKKMWNALKDIINTMLGGIEGMCNGVVRGINGLTGTLNKLNIDLPDWTGIGSIGFNIPKMSTISIPRLATGTVVPANYGNFLAVLGDNKKEPEVVAPQSTIEKAMENVLKRNAINSSSDINLTVNLDGETVYKNTVKHNNRNTRMTGHNALLGGI